MISVGQTALLRSFVPLDDHHAMLVSQLADPVNPIPEEQRVAAAAHTFDCFHGFIERTNDSRWYFITVANERNGYLRNMELREKRLFFGVPFVANSRTGR